MAPLDPSAASISFARVERTLLSAAAAVGVGVAFAFRVGVFEWPPLALRRPPFPGRKSRPTSSSKAADKSVRPARLFNLSHPKPPIVLRTNHQPRPHRILPDILKFLAETFIGPQHMVERLILPNWTGNAEQSIYAPSRHSLDQLQDEGQRIRPTLRAARRS